MFRCGIGKVLLCLPALILCRPLLQSEEMLVEAKAYLSRSAVHPGEEFQVALQVKVKKGWHINAAEVEDELLIPTSFSIQEGEGVNVVEISLPRPKLSRFGYSETPLSHYDGEVFFGARLRTGADLSPGKGEISMEFSYQACDDRSCRPPRTIALAVPFEIVPVSLPTHSVHPEIFAKIQFPKKEGTKL